MPNASVGNQSIYFQKSAAPQKVGMFHGTSADSRPITSGCSMEQPYYYQSSSFSAIELLLLAASMESSGHYSWHFASISGDLPEKRKKLQGFIVIFKKMFVSLQTAIELKAIKKNHSDMGKIDNLDRKILSIVINNARIPSKDVAAECGVSRAAIHQRLQRMMDMGVITGSSYNVNAKELGFRTCTYIGVNLERGGIYHDVVPEIEKIPEIVEYHFTTGPYTLLLKLYARDNEHLMELLNKRIQSIPGVMGTETLISLERSFHRKIPISAE